MKNGWKDDEEQGEAYTENWLQGSSRALIAQTKVNWLWSSAFLASDAKMHISLTHTHPAEREKWKKKTTGVYLKLEDYTLVYFSVGVEINWGRSSYTDCSSDSQNTKLQLNLVLPLNKILLYTKYKIRNCRMHIAQQHKHYVCMYVALIQKTTGICC